VWVTGGNVSDKEKDTKPGAMDDDSMHRAKKNKKKKHDMMKALQRSTTRSPSNSFRSSRPITITTLWQR
jgi:hypothetical protein